MKTIENIKQLIKGLGPDRVVEVAVRKLQDLLFAIENAEFKYSQLKNDNDILRQAQRNQAMGSAEMMRENESLKAELAELRMQYISDFGQEQYSDEKHGRDVAIRKQSFHRFNNSGISE